MKSTIKGLPSPIFLLGTQRSGTTLLTRILSAHKDIFIQNELPLQTIFTKQASRADIIYNIDKHFQFRYYASIEEYLKQGNKSVWGLKDPQLTEYIDTLEDFVPQSKFIIIIRDARGVVNSYIENKWGLGTNAFTGALRWKEEVEQQVAFSEKHPDSCLVIRFEDLIENLENQVRKVCKHLEIEYDAGMLDYHKEKMMYEPNKQNINTNKAPDKSLATQWGKKLSQNEVDIINAYAGDMLFKFGYIEAKKEGHLSELSKFFYKMHQAILGELQIQYRLKMPKLKKLFK